MEKLAEIVVQVGLQDFFFTDLVLEIMSIKKKTR